MIDANKKLKAVIFGNPWRRRIVVMRVSWGEKEEGDDKKFAHFADLEFVRNYQYLKMLSVSAMPEERELGKAYREFSRRRYLELKASGSIVRESELVQIIIREWDSMTLT